MHRSSWLSDFWVLFCPPSVQNLRSSSFGISMASPLCSWTSSHLQDSLVRAISRTCLPLKTQTSLNKESRPFFLGDTPHLEFSLCFFAQPLQHVGPEGYFHFSLAIIAFGAFEFIVPKLLSLRKHGQEESRLRHVRRLTVWQQTRYTS